MKRMIVGVAAMACTFAGISSAALAQQAAPDVAPPSVSAGATATPITKETVLGRDAFSQDQTLVGPVERVATAEDGRVQAIYIRTGGFLGFGARLVAVPEGKFHMRGQNVQLQLSTEDLNRMPDVKDAS